MAKGGSVALGSPDLEATGAETGRPPHASALGVPLAATGAGDHGKAPP
jgi:hypothetical protein